MIWRAWHWIAWSCFHSTAVYHQSTRWLLVSTNQMSFVFPFWSWDFSLINAFAYATGCLLLSCLDEKFLWDIIVALRWILFIFFEEQCYLCAFMQQCALCWSIKVLGAVAKLISSFSRKWNHVLSSKLMTKAGKWVHFLMTNQKHHTIWLFCYISQFVQPWMQILLILLCFSSPQWATSKRSGVSTARTSRCWASTRWPWKISLITTGPKTVKERTASSGVAGDRTRFRFLIQVFLRVWTGLLSSRSASVRSISCRVGWRES